MFHHAEFENRILQHTSPSSSLQQAVGKISISNSPNDRFIPTR